MKLTSRNELSKYRILPFNLYNEAGDLVLKAGDALTMGKLMQLKAYDKIFKDNDFSEENQQQKDSLCQTDNKSDKQNIEEDDINDSFEYDDINIKEYKTPINKFSKIDFKDQVKIKTYFSKTLNLLAKTSIANAFPKLAELSVILVDIVIAKFEQVKYYSELRLVGEYEVCHPINVAIMGAMIAKKMDFEHDFIADIITAGILHDIGKYRIPNAFNGIKFNTSKVDEMKKHTIIGYNILKNELEQPEHICNVALQHHEHNDGTGYPHGISSDWISIESQIINVCNSYDNFAFNKTGYLVKNSRDIIRLMLSIGTKKFSAEILYTFAHMYSYNDNMNFIDLEGFIK